MTAREDEHRLYFAYGVDMSSAEMRARQLNPKVVGAARVADFQLVFCDQDPVWAGAMASLAPKPGAEVWGVVYQFDRRDFERLDTFVDVRGDGTGASFHYPVTANLVVAAPVVALTYRRDRRVTNDPPSRPYLEAMIAGAQEHRLPKHYIAMLSSLPSREPTGGLARRVRSLQTISECSGCTEPQPAREGSSSESP